MQKTSAKDAIVYALKQAESPVNFERLFEKVKDIHYCSRKTFSGHLQTLVKDKMVTRKEITSRNVRYSINEKNIEKIAKNIENKKEFEKLPEELLKRIKNFKHYKTHGIKKSEFIKEITDETLAMLEGIKALIFIEAYGNTKQRESKQIKEILKNAQSELSEIFEELKKRDQSMHKLVYIKIYFKIISNINSMSQ